MDIGGSGRRVAIVVTLPSCLFLEVSSRPATYLKLVIRRYRYLVCSSKSRDGKSIIPKTQTEEGHCDSLLEEDRWSERIPDLLQQLQKVEGQKTEADF